MKDSTTHLKNIFIGLLLAALIIFISLFIINKRNSDHWKKIAINQGTLIDKINTDPVKPAEPVKTYTDKVTGEQHAVYKTPLPMTKEQLKQALVSPSLLDTVSRALDIKVKQVTTLTQFKLQSEARAVKAEAERDSLKNIVFKYQNKYIKLAFTPKNKVDTVDRFDYQYNTDLNVVEYDKRKFQPLGIPLGQITNYTDIYPSDPNGTIRGLKKFSIEKKLPYTGLVLQLKNNWNFRTKVYSPGLGLQYRLGRFLGSAAAFYDIQNNVLNPQGTINYDLLRF